MRKGADPVESGSQLYWGRHLMKDNSDGLNPEPGQTAMSSFLPIVAVLFIFASIYGFFTSGWRHGLCFLAGSVVLFSLGAV